MGLISEIAKAAKIPVDEDSSMELISAEHVFLFLETIRKLQKYRVVGLEGFRMRGNQLIPEMDAIADFQHRQSVWIVTLLLMKLWPSCQR